MACFHALCSNGEDCAWIDCWACSYDVLGYDDGPVAPALDFLEARGVVAYA